MMIHSSHHSLRRHTDGPGQKSYEARRDTDQDTGAVNEGEGQSGGTVKLGGASTSIKDRAAAVKGDHPQCICARSCSRPSASAWGDRDWYHFV